tara:strand:- start:149 stop:337 length:189 start_codon:yes stop_codon:yes gene_type:complete
MLKDIILKNLKKEGIEKKRRNYLTMKILAEFNLCCLGTIHIFENGTEYKSNIPNTNSSGDAS